MSPSQVMNDDDERLFIDDDDDDATTTTTIDDEPASSSSMSGCVTRLDSLEAFAPTLLREQYRYNRTDTQLHIYPILQPISERGPYSSLLQIKSIVKWKIE